MMTKIRSREGQAAASLVLLLMTGAVASAEANTAEEAFVLAADVIQTQGFGTLSGPLLVALAEDQGSSRDRPSADFVLEAPEVRVERDIADAALYAGTVWYAHDPRTESVVVNNATLEGDSLRQGFRLAIFPLSARLEAWVAAASDCGRITTPNEGEISRNARVSYARAPRAADVSSGVEWETCSDGASLTITGSFIVSLWEWDATLQGDDHYEILTTGSQEKLPGSPQPIAGTIARDQEAFIVVRNGTMRMQPSPSSGWRVIAESESNLATEAAVQFTNAAGQTPLDYLDGTVNGEVVVVHGKLGVAVAGDNQSQRIFGTVSGSVRAIHVNGDLLFVAPVMHPDAGVSMRWIGAVAVALGLALAMVVYRFPTSYYRHLRSSGAYLGSSRPVTSRAQRAMGYWSLARYLHDRGRFRVATWMASRAVRLAPDVTDHRIMRALLHYETGRWKEAYRDLVHVEPRLPAGSERALNACELAALCCLMRRNDEALQWLQRAERSDIDTLLQEIARPELQPLNNDPWMARLKASSLSARVEVGATSDPAIA